MATQNSHVFFQEIHFPTHHFGHPAVSFRVCNPEILGHTWIQFLGSHQHSYLEQRFQNPYDLPLNPDWFTTGSLHGPIIYSLYNWGSFSSPRKKQQKFNQGPLKWSLLTEKLAYEFLWSTPTLLGTNFWRYLRLHLGGRIPLI